MSEITIKLNGEEEQLQKGITVQQLLDFKQIKAKMMVVELNLQIIDKKDYETTSIKQGDSIEIVGFFGGG